MDHSAPLRFKFRFVKNGQPAHMLSKAGSAGEDGLELAGDRLRYDDVADTTTRDNRLIVTLRAGADLGPVMTKHLAEPGVLVLETYKAGARDVERYVDRRASARETELHRQALQAAGTPELYRVLSCPHCYATIDLSELDRTSYVYCRFCESVLEQAGPTSTLGETYRVCDDCSHFDRVQSYTEFYFYFLVFLYGFSYKKRHLCDNCAGRTFWKVFLMNAVFVLGVPSAIWLKLKSLRGREPRLAELAKANALAKQGRVDEAHGLFTALHERLPDHPGLLYDQGLGALAAGRADEAMGYFERSLRACANFLPTLRFLAALQAALPAEGEGA